MNFGCFIKWSDSEYDVLVDKDKRNSGYNVVSKETDPHNKYSLEEVKAYAQAHPEMELPQWPEEKPSYDELCTAVKDEQHARIEAVRWRVDRYDDETRQSLPHKEDIAPVLTYIQAVRDVDDQPGYPSRITWPDEP
jgi:hypothetical protein